MTTTATPVSATKTRKPPKANGKPRMNAGGIISAVAACCWRASLRSLAAVETERRLTRLAAGAIRRLVLVVLRPFAGLARLAFALRVLPPVLDGRLMAAPQVKKSILAG